MKLEVIFPELKENFVHKLVLALNAAFLGIDSQLLKEWTVYPTRPGVLWMKAENLLLLVAVFVLLFFMIYGITVPIMNALGM
ncbi:hypothetical protein EU538_00080 [Candidatus Thorarchaeota archaeon]|jgi:hypothetical protein|nr:MAG: hypothetical protein EU538_00080 [Candidatus Thorarchaeota archaeon]